MKRNLCIAATFVVVLLALVFSQSYLDSVAQAQARAAVQAPRFEVDPLWPKPLPNNWAIGSSIGVSVDAQDHVWMIHRPDTLLANETAAAGDSPTASCCKPAPPVLEFDPAGYVSDKEKVDADALFKQLKSQEADANELRKSLGQSGLYLDRWLAPPHYDAASHNLEWGTVMHSGSGGQIINYTSRILGRDGVTKAILVSDPANFSADLPQYRSVLAGFAYQPDKAYEAHQAGDKVAAYGLGALVAGGAAAAVVKSGLFAGLLAAVLKFGVAFYKLIIIGAVALFAGFRKQLARLFGRAAPTEGDQV